MFKRFLFAAVLAASFVSAPIAIAQFAEGLVTCDAATNSKCPAGPVAVGQAQLDRAPDGRIALIQAPAVQPAPTSGGIIQLSALGWLEPYVDTIVQALIVAFFGWLGKSKYGQWMDETSRDALQTFAKNRAASMIADGGVWMKDKAVHVDNALLYKAASEATTAIPDALKRFKLTPDVIAAKIIDAIPQTEAGAAIVATAHTNDSSEPVTVTDRPSAAPEVAAPNNPPVAASDV